CHHETFAHHLEQHWGNELCYIFIPWYVNNGVRRWAEINYGEDAFKQPYVICSDREVTTSWYGGGITRITRNYPIPRDLEKQRETWMHRLAHPIKVYNQMPTGNYGTPNLRPPGEQLHFQF